MTVDASSLASLRAVGGHAFVQQVANLFMNDAPRRAQSMREGASACDLEAIARAAHSIRGSCGAFGADRLTDLCRRVERLVRSRQTTQLAEEVDAVVGEVRAVCEALRQYLEVAPADLVPEPPRF